MDTESGEPEPVTHSFIVKVWLEQSSEQTQPSWRGHVTHVPSGERRHFLDPNGVTDFISGFLVDPVPEESRSGEEAGNG